MGEEKHHATCGSPRVMASARSRESARVQRGCVANMALMRVKRGPYRMPSTRSYPGRRRDSAHSEARSGSRAQGGEGGPRAAADPKGALAGKGVRGCAGASGGQALPPDRTWVFARRRRMRSMAGWGCGPGSYPARVSAAMEGGPETGSRATPRSQATIGFMSIESRWKKQG